MLTKLVRNTVIVSALALLALSVASEKSLANQVVVINNQNRQRIIGVFVKLPSEHYWNSAYPYFISPAKIASINFITTKCVFDFKIIYQNGSFDQGRHNICERNTLLYIGNGGDYLTNPSTANIYPSPQGGINLTDILRNAGNALPYIR